MSMACKPRCGRFILLAIVGVAALGGVVMALWNWLMPALFIGAREIDYLQAMGVLLLSRILFGGFRGHRHPRWPPGRWEQMSPEERERFRAGMRNWCGTRRQETPDGPDQPAA